MANSGSALFLDLDGTLAESISVMRLVYAGFLEGFGKTGNDAEFARLNGPPLQQVVASLAAAHRLSPPVDELLANYRSLIKAAYMDVVPKSGANDLFETARRLGVRTGVVTSNSTDLTWSWLHRVGLTEMVDAVVGGDETDLGKPHPEPYLLALKRTECEANKSFAVEDSFAGARAAMTAGLHTFLLSSTHDRHTSGVMAISGLDEVADFIMRKNHECGVRH
jgi:beta-phosphoglucomutase-like phosphatase (HAD superfamily)